MSKIRTRHQKERPKHSFVYQWQAANTVTQAGPVKRQFNSEAKTNFGEANSKKNANILEKDTALEGIKKNILKSLILASFILAIELVLYLARNRIF